jgi:AcrR family transcriptional regulator
VTVTRSIEAEFERFAADLVGGRQPGRGDRSPQPSITAAFIYERALELVESQGVDALTVRRLAAELKISTRTLYKRIGSRTRMIGELINLHSARLHLDFQPLGTWEETIWAWYRQLHRALTAQPHLTDMLQGRILAAIASHVESLIDAVVLDGLPRDIAAECCWSVADLTINDATAVARKLTRRRLLHPARTSVEPSKTTADAVKWIVRGVDAETK